MAIQHKKGQVAVKPPKKIYLSKRVLSEPVGSMKLETYWCPSVSGTDFEYVMKGTELKRIEKWLDRNINITGNIELFNFRCDLRAKIKKEGK